MSRIKNAKSGFSRELIELINAKLSTSCDNYLSLRDALEILCLKIGASRGMIKLYNRFDQNFIQDIIWPDGEASEEENKVARMVIDCGNVPYCDINSDGGAENCSIFGFPISRNEYPLGVVLFHGESSDGAKHVFSKKLDEFLPLLVIPTENLLLHKALIESYLRTIESLALALEAKDNYTLGHSNMVMAYSLSLADQLGLGKECKEAIEIGALMHDIGKIGVRDEILQKKEDLTDDEFEEIKRHPVIGDQILAPLQHEVLELPRKIVRWHHEMLNGRGYPDGVTGDVLPIEVRIVSVADMFEALTSDRPYRSAIDTYHAVQILKKSSPGHLDPDVVKAMENIILG